MVYVKLKAQKMSNQSPTLRCGSLGKKKPNWVVPIKFAQLSYKVLWPTRAKMVELEGPAKPRPSHLCPFGFFLDYFDIERDLNHTKRLIRVIWA